jgi:Fuc2NAc and GlcNAc transferase
MLLLCLLVASTLGLLLYLKIAPYWGLVDHPTDRGLHVEPTVVGAGVVPVNLLAALVALGHPADGAGVVALFLMLLSVIGLIDDRWGLASSLRLFCYLAVGLLTPWLIFPEPPLSGVALMVVGLGVAWCINLFNFMDGADGLATVQLLCVSVGLGLMAHFGPSDYSGWVEWCAGAVICCLPLLWLNWPPAQLFMGDAGAIPLGFFLAVLGLLAFDQSMLLGWAWVVLMMPFFLDTGITLLIRLVLGKAPQVAHRDHAYQRLILRVGSPLPVTLGLLAMQVVWQYPLAILIVHNQLPLPLLVLLSTIPAVSVVVYARTRA